MRYRSTIHSSDTGNHAKLGSITLPDDDSALAFGNDVIRDMLAGNPRSFFAMEIFEAERAVCRIPFPPRA